MNVYSNKTTFKQDNTYIAVKNIQQWLSIIIAPLWRSTAFIQPGRFSVKLCALTVLNSLRTEPFSLNIFYRSIIHF